MRVIQPGYIEESSIFCNYCGATLGYYPADVRHKNLGGNAWTYIICSICGKAVVIAKEEDSWKDLLD